MAFLGVFPLPNVKLTWGKFDLFADKELFTNYMIKKIYFSLESNLRLLLTCVAETDLTTFSYFWLDYGLYKL